MAEVTPVMPNEVRDRRPVGRGALMSVLAGLTVAAGVVAITLLAGLGYLYLLLLIGVASGAAMATQLEGKNTTGGLVAAMVTATITAVTIPALTIGAEMSSSSIAVGEAMRATGGVGHTYSELIASTGTLTWLYIGGAIVVGFVFGAFLGSGRPPADVYEI